jgi:hypothetical protein
MLFAQRGQIGGLAAKSRTSRDTSAALPSTRTRSSRARTADLPVEPPRAFELVIDLGTAEVLGRALAPSLLLGADAVIHS